MTHQGLFPAVTLSFNLAPGVALGDAVDAVYAAAQKVGLPPTIHTGFSGTAQAYQDSLGSEPLLIAAALAAVYIVLGMLYESYIHPITILSTLPSAGVGALLALMLTRTDLSIIAIIGIILLIGIVKKNAILMIDFALVAERNGGQELPRLDLRGLHAAVPADPDDDDGRDARRAAAGAGPGRGLGAAPAAGHHDHRRPDREPGAHAVHHAGRLPVSRPAAALVVSLETVMIRTFALCRRPRRVVVLVVTALALGSGACVVGPAYHRPEAPMSPAFKEAPPDGWKTRRTQATA